MEPRWADYEYGNDDVDNIAIPWLEDKKGCSSGSAGPEQSPTFPWLPRSWAQVITGGSTPGLGGVLESSTLPSSGDLKVSPDAVADKAASGASRSRSNRYSVPACPPEPGDPVGLRAVQSILMSATQTNLSHFHTAGMSTSGLAATPSAAEAMDSLYTKHNTGMRFETSAGVKDIRRLMVGASLGSFVTTVGSSFTLLPKRENVWYDALGVPTHDSVLRLYINYKKMRDHGLTLAVLAQEAFGSDCSWRVSPDFMGMIDVEVKGIHMSSWLSRMGCCVCGTPNVVSCDVVDGSTAVTRGTDVLAASRTPGVDKRTIVSNNVTEVEKMFGVEAAARMLTGLVGSRTVSDFMARTGKIMPFSKRSKEVKTRGLLTSMGFERPKDDIKRAVASARSRGGLQVHECIMTGLDPFPGFDVIT